VTAHQKIDIAGDLLAWYDVHARDLPWRVHPAERMAGRRPDPYHVWLSEVMLQQTTVAAVKAYFRAFTLRWPRLADLAAAPDGDVMAAWAGLGYYARARNMLACARTVMADYGGSFPQDAGDLQRLPGIGPYTAAAISAIAFDRPAVVVDGNIERVMARLFNEDAPLPASKPILTGYAAQLAPDQRPGCYAQALMDLGATICTPRNPACGICPLRPHCAGAAAGRAADLPIKTPKKPKPIRTGILYLAQRSDGAWLLERRPPKGLLGGTLAWPSSEWTDGIPPEAPPLDAPWHRLNHGFRHTFTHFHLDVQIARANVQVDAIPTRGWFQPLDAFAPADLPTVMRKAFDLAQAQD
jgi:A/G-specific adenine glycosylase